MKFDANERKLERFISYLLIGGVLLSVGIEAVGMGGYYFTEKNLDIVFQPSFSMAGRDFFTYTVGLLHQFFTGTWTPINVLSLGIVLLMLTPYLRVVVSVIYFGLAKNVKYLFITLFVMVVLTATLLVH